MDTYLDLLVSYIQRLFVFAIIHSCAPESLQNKCGYLKGHNQLVTLSHLAHVACNKLSYSSANAFLVVYMYFNR